MYFTSWQIDGESVETVADFIFLGSKITGDGDCSHEIKRCLLLGRKVMTNLDSILKNRDITLSTEVRLVKAMVFPVVIYGKPTDPRSSVSYKHKNQGKEIHQDVSQSKSLKPVIKRKSLCQKKRDTFI